MNEFYIKNSNEDDQKIKNEVQQNIYGYNPFLPETAREHVESLVDSFRDYYAKLGYIEEESIPISSGIDKTVRFIGSHISVFKPYISNNNVPAPGIFMRQNCLRTRNADKLLEDDYSPNWGSYFPSIGAITPPDRLNEVCGETFNFFEKKLNVSSENLLIRISSSDEDLITACREYYGDEKFEVDGQKPEYYKHKIGMDGVKGRSFNVALRNPNGEGFTDVGNIILLEDDIKKLGVEIALGSTTILKQLHSLNHVQDCTPVEGLALLDDEVIRRKFEDAIITSTVLYREGLRPFGQNNRNRILKQYIRSLSYFRGKSGINMETLAQIMVDFEKREFPDTTDVVSNIIIEFIQSFENELILKKDLTSEDSKIKDALLAEY